MTSLDDLVRPGRYPLSSKYDPAWLAKLDMGTVCIMLDADEGKYLSFALVAARKIG